MCISLCIHNLRPYFQLMKYLFGNKEFLPNNWISQILARFVCGMAYTNVFCDNFLFLIVGPDSNQLNKVDKFLFYTDSLYVLLLLSSS